MAQSEIDNDVLMRVETINSIKLDTNPRPAAAQTPAQISSEEAPVQTSDSAEPKKLPMVVPQLRWEHGQGVFGSPFARVYPVELSNYGIPKAEFLTFLDGFNDIFTTTRTGQSLNFGFRVLQLAYGHRTVELDDPHSKADPTLEEIKPGESKSYGRVLLYLQAVNKDVFHPKGLHVSILRTDDMTHKVGYPSAKLALLPRENVQGQSAEAHAVAQRMKPLHGYVSDIDTDVPKHGHSSNLFMSLVEHRNHRKEKAKDKRQAFRDKNKNSLMQELAKKDSMIQQRLDHFEAKLLEKKEIAERKIAAGDTRAEAEFDRAKARIMKDIEIYTKMKPGDKPFRPMDKELIEATHQAQVSASHMRWIVITPAAGVANKGAEHDLTPHGDHQDDVMTSEDELHHA